jgi:HAD superfamily hydrolase (TIGR01509 family)
MKKVVIFDMDGVLIDTESVHDLSWKETFEHFGYDVSIQDRHQFIGRGAKNYIAYLYELVDTEEKVQKIRSYQRNFYHNYFANNPKEVKPGVVDLIESLKKRGVKIAVASQTRQASAIKSLTETNLIHLFDYSIFGDMVKESKPNPELFLKAQAFFNVDKADMLILEDSYYGVKAANNANIDVVWIKDVVDLSNETDINYIETFDSLIEAKDYVLSLIVQ